MKYTAALLVVLLAVSTFGARSDSEYRDMFVRFMREHKKVYKHEEFQSRFATFKNNVNLIDATNAANKTYTLAMNKFGDLSSQEMHALFTGVRVNGKSPKNVVSLPTTTLPSTVDWRKHDAVTAIKNQGQCGSCWSFSTTGSLEGLHAIKKGSLLSFSEQQLVDCSQSYGNNGCDGGLMDDAFQYVESQGIETEKQYPYDAEDGSCNYNSNDVVFKNTGYQDVPANTPSQLQAAVANQPVSIAIEADQSVFQFYSGGVLNDESCGTSLDHGVLIVGYGTQGGQAYWIVKNSWGADWGMSGYVLIARDTKDGGDGICGINMMPSYPTL